MTGVQTCALPIFWNGISFRVTAAVVVTDVVTVTVRGQSLHGGYLIASSLATNIFNLTGALHLIVQCLIV